MRMAVEVTAAVEGAKFGLRSEPALNEAEGQAALSETEVK